MSDIDGRRPALVTEDFRARILRDLSPLGFEARSEGKVLVRKRGKNVHLVDRPQPEYFQYYSRHEQPFWPVPPAAASPSIP
jgi:hypothetical protein